MHHSSLRAQAKDGAETCGPGTVRSAVVSLKPMRTLEAKERTPTCFACGAWPVEEPSIVLSHMPAGRPFWKGTSGRSLTLAGYSKSFAMTT